MSYNIGNTNASASSSGSGTRAPQNTPARGNSPNTNQNDTEWWAYGYVSKGHQDWPEDEEMVSFRFSKGPGVTLKYADAVQARNCMPGKRWSDDLPVKVTFQTLTNKVIKVDHWNGIVPPREVAGGIPQF